jgi:tripartite-type tricarboxylate transporter receptor subunit TctC
MNGFSYPQRSLRSRRLLRISRYTLLMIDVSPEINATLFEKLNAPVANVVRVANVMVVKPSFPTKTVPEFIAYPNPSTRPNMWTRNPFGLT